MSVRRWLPRTDPQTHDPGVAGNESLTSGTGLLLIPLLGAVGLTGVAFGSLWHAHFVLGILLVPVILLKLATTTYRAARYYTRNRRYRDAGPPALPLRLLAPPLIAATVVAMVSGIVMWLDNNQDRPWSTIHTTSVVIMGVLVGIHALAYLPLASRAVRRDWTQTTSARRGAALRLSTVVAVLVVGIVVGFATQPSVPFPVHERGRGAAAVTR